MESIAWKRLYVDTNHNKEGKNFEKYKDKDSRYINISLCSSEKSNRPIDLSKAIRNLNHLISIQKLLHQIIDYFMWEFQSDGVLKAQKKSILAAYERG